MDGETEPTETKDVRSGAKVDWARFGVPVTMETFHHGDTLYAVWDGFAHAAIDIDGMSFTEVCEAVKVAVHGLNQSRPAYASHGIH